MKRFYFASTLFSVILLTGCRGSDQKHVSDNQSVKVKVMQISSSAINETKRFSGTVEEENGTSLSFPVMGTVKNVHVNLGDHVTKGQLIATLDPQTMQSSYNAAKSSLEQAEDAHRRMKELYEKGSLPEIKWTETQSQLQQARAMEEIAGKNLKDCKLYASFNGVIAEKTTEVGQNVVPGMTIVKLVTASLLKVKISVPETEIAKIALKQEANITVPALDNKTFGGTVSEKGIVANPLSRSYDVKIRVENIGTDLMPGMVTEVMIRQAEISSRCVIPANIVQLDETNNLFVWIDNEGKASKRIITGGDFTANGITILAGLKEGDRIITEGQHKVCEGSKLTF